MFASLPVILFLAVGVLGYDDKFSEIDVDAVIADDELFMSYLNCFINKGPCTAKYATEYKGILPEIIKEACGKCNDVQKEKIKKLVSTIYEKKPDIATELQKLYDPNMEHNKKFSEFLTSK